MSRRSRVGSGGVREEGGGEGMGGGEVEERKERQRDNK